MKTNAVLNPDCQKKSMEETLETTAEDGAGVAVLYNSKNPVVDEQTAASRESSAKPGVKQNHGGLVIAVITAVPSPAEALIQHPQNPRDQPVLARALVSLSKNDVARQAAVLFEENDPARPIIVGLIQSPLSPEHPLEAVIDGEKVLITGKREIVLKCGEASITLTRAGKVLVKGEYVLTKAKGVNRIRGASVQIN